MASIVTGCGPRGPVSSCSTRLTVFAVTFANSATSRTPSFNIARAARYLRDTLARKPIYLAEAPCVNRSRQQKPRRAIAYLGHTATASHAELSSVPMATPRSLVATHSVTNVELPRSTSETGAILSVQLNEHVHRRSPKSISEGRKHCTDTTYYLGAVGRRRCGTLLARRRFARHDRTAFAGEKPTSGRALIP